MSNQLSLLLLPLVTIGAVTSQALMKRGVQQMGGITPELLLRPLELIWLILQTPSLLLGGLCSLAAALVWLMALSRFDLSLAGAIVGAGYYIILGIVSWYFLGEQIGPAKVIGLATISVGVLIVVLN